MTDIFRDYRWHSCSEPKKGMEGKRIVRSLVANEENLSKFTTISRNANVLIHKSTTALWKFSKDGKTIEPVYQENMMTEDEL